MTSKLERRISSYLAKIPPAVSGHGGHIQTYYVARILVHGFGLSDTDAMTFMYEYNARCAPPWREKELRHKLQSARKFGAGDMKRLK
jgi:hypothetical protein